MPQLQLTAAALPHLSNGLFAVIVDAELEKIAADLDDRGKDGQARKLLIELEFKIDPRSKTEVVAIIPKVQAKLPPLIADPTTANVRTGSGKSGMSFQSNNADNPDQPIFKQMDDQ